MNILTIIEIKKYSHFVEGSEGKWEKRIEEDTGKIVWELMLVAYGIRRKQDGSLIDFFATAISIVKKRTKKTEEMAREDCYKKLKEFIGKNWKEGFKFFGEVKRKSPEEKYLKQKYSQNFTSDVFKKITK